MSTRSAQTIVSKYHFPLEGAKGCLEKLRFQGWSKFVLKDAQLFVCIKINQKHDVTPESKKLARISTVCTKDRSPGKRRILSLMAEAGFTKNLENSLLFIGHYG